MNSRLRYKLKRAQRLSETVPVTDCPADGGAGDYTHDPVGYCFDVLQLPSLWGQLAEVMRLLCVPPYRVLVRSAHNVGKTFAAGCITNWWFDTFDPSVVITTAPTERDVVDLLWTEIRLQRLRAGLPCSFIGPRAAEMRTSTDHYAKGYTARKGESFQGRHREHMLFIFDECEGVDALYWDTLNTMFKPEEGHACLAIGNPLTTSSRAYQEETALDHQGNPKWHVVTLNALEHPNIGAALAGKELPVPAAVSLEQIETWISDWCDPVPVGEECATDFQWPPPLVCPCRRKD